MSADVQPDVPSALVKAGLAGLPSSAVTVGDIVHREIVECAPSTPLSEAASRMTEARVSSILVMDNGKVAGIWTERDALAVDFSNPDSFNVPISSCMSTPVRTVTEDVSLQDLAVRFRDEHLRHYLIVDGEGKPCGVVSQSDVVLNQGIEHYLRLRQVDSVVKKGLNTLPPESSLREVARAMRERGCDAVVIEYAPCDFGIITERDLTRFIAQQQHAETAGALASRPLLVIGEQASLYHARCMLTEHRVRHLGVVREDGTLADLIGFGDILSGMELIYVQELRTALQERDQALNVSRRNLRMAEKIIETSFEGVIVTDAQGLIQSVNPAFTRLTGYQPEEVIGKNPSILSSGRHGPDFYRELWDTLEREGRWQGEMWNRRKNGEIYPELLTITAITDEFGTLTNYAAVFSDISQLKADEMRIRHLAYFDPLTNLPNRRLLDDRLNVAFAHAHRSGGRLAVLFIDLDGFKSINDRLGHDAGDELLVAAAQRLSTCLREGDTVARLGGDEFVILISGAESPQSAAMVAQRLIESLKAPVIIEGEALTLSASIGISYYPDHGETPEELLKMADTAMYRAKALGRNRYVVFEKSE